MTTKTIPFILVSGLCVVFGVPALWMIWCIMLDWDRLHWKLQ